MSLYVVRGALGALHLVSAKYPPLRTATDPTTDSAASLIPPHVIHSARSHHVVKTILTLSLNSLVLLYQSPTTGSSDSIKQQSLFAQDSACMGVTYQDQSVFATVYGGLECCRLLFEDNQFVVHHLLTISEFEILIKPLQRLLKTLCTTFDLSHHHPLILDSFKKLASLAIFSQQ